MKSVAFSSLIEAQERSDELARRLASVEATLSSIPRPARRTRDTIREGHIRAKERIMAEAREVKRWIRDEHVRIHADRVGSDARPVVMALVRCLRDAYPGDDIPAGVAAVISNARDWLTADRTRAQSDAEYGGE